MPSFISHIPMTRAKIPDRSNITGERLILTLLHELGQKIRAAGPHGRRGGSLHGRQGEWDSSRKWIGQDTAGGASFLQLGSTASISHSSQNSATDWKTKGFIYTPVRGISNSDWKTSLSLFISVLVTSLT